MKIMKVDGELFQTIITNGAASLRLNYKTIDALNVFPVPDGDTGTNMRMTIEAGVKNIGGTADKSIYEMSKKLSRGMLMGARGNSGVILSQFFRGVYKGLNGIEEAGAVELAKAFKSGVQQAYKAVMKPVEGTILTVAREASEYAFKKVNKKSSIQDYFKHFLDEAHASLARTPELLVVLKDAGVVDSGAAGFICIIEGIAKGVDGEIINTDDIATLEVPNAMGLGTFNAHSELVYGYCTEFILQLQHKKINLATFDVKVIIDFLVSIGDSVVCIRDEDIVKAHVHTKKPGEVLNYCQQFGEYVTLKIENMSVQHNESVEVQEQCNCEECVEMRKSATKKKYAIVAVASGEGLISAFKIMGVDYVVSGGQTMNPSTDDFVKAFDSLNAENIIVFPNNGNIIMAATQAGHYYKDAKVHVVKSKSLAQGYAALTTLDTSSGNTEKILEDITNVIHNVTTGLITYSIRNADIEGIKIHEGDYIAICNGQMVASEKTRLEAIKTMLSKQDLSNREIVTIIYGADINEEMLSEVCEYIENTYPNLEVDTLDGKQDVYSFILAIE